MFVQIPPGRALPANYTGSAISAPAGQTCLACRRSKCWTTSLAEKICLVTLCALTVDPNQRQKIASIAK
eukprot:4116559-Karenia_brevis.AAC.1